MIGRTRSRTPCHRTRSCSFARDTVTPANVQWLWRGWLPLGMLSIWSGSRAAEDDVRGADRRGRDPGQARGDLLTSLQAC